MNWGENFWIWMATEVFFGIFVAVVLYYYFVYKPQRDNHEKPSKKQ